MTEPVDAQPLSLELFAPGQRLEVGSPVHLLASRCPRCGRHEFPSRAECPACGDSSESVGLSTDAVIARFTSVNHSPPGGQLPVPYIVAAASFPEGVTILGPMQDVSYDAISVGDSVRTIGITVGERIGFGWKLSRTTH